MEYLNFGGYPRVVLEERKDEKIRVIDEIYRSVLERDVAYLLKVEKTEAFSNLIKVLAGQIGNLINYKELSSTLDISFATLKKYLWYARKIFLLDLVTPYSRNVRKEISLSPVVYFGDLGMRNYPLGIFGNVRSPTDCGFLFQNLLYLTLTPGSPIGSNRVHFWRTKDKAEVDFVVEKGKAVIPIEAKYKAFKDIEIPRALLSFCEQYRPAEAYVVNLSLRKRTRVGNTSVYAIPYWELPHKLSG
jgi:predicted AAA+ superfamily ATPase